jgi:UDP-N-acetylglucosamine--N-acetylmuramyl-(pentapeptide) pyrophosphoryl-undecaprenol N-acetylglucosamine transferase
MTVGNPIRKRVFSDISKAEAKKLFHLSHSKKVILAIGGSQGAVKINELIYGLKKNFPDELKDTGIIWSTGDYSYEKYSTLVKEELDGGSVFLSPFIERVGEAYAAADFAVSRSGAGVMMELAAMGIPSLLIPYPFAAYDHQNKNADSFVEAGAAVKIMDSESTPENGARVLFDILNNPRMLKDMSEAALAAAKPEAAASIVDSIVEDLSK